MQMAGAYKGIGTVGSPASHCRRCVTEDPGFITSTAWADIRWFLILLWLLPLPVIGFAGSMLVAHGLIPSLAESGDIKDPRILKLRPVFYGAAAISFVLIIVVVAIGIPWIEMVNGVYGRWWV